MAQQPGLQADRRRVTRTALRLNATMRDGRSSRTKVRVIDMSTHGCRVECSSTLATDAWIWLSIAGLETQFSRVVWHCQEFVGLEFEKPIAEPVFERLMQDQQLPETAINDLRSIASRANWLARQAGDEDIAILAELSRKCAEDAVVEGLRLGEGANKRPTPR